MPSVYVGWGRWKERGGQGPRATALQNVALARPSASVDTVHIQVQAWPVQSFVWWFNNKSKCFMLTIFIYLNKSFDLFDFLNRSNLYIWRPGQNCNDHKLIGLYLKRVSHNQCLKFVSISIISLEEVLEDDVEKASSSLWKAFYLTFLQRPHFMFVNKLNGCNCTVMYSCLSSQTHWFTPLN